MSDKIFTTDKKESFRSKLERLFFNFYPSYRRSGGKVLFISGDWKEVHIKLKYNWKTKNYMGTLFGGCMYSALDPIYMAQLINILGKNYIVWDKSAAIKYVKPVYTSVYAKFEISDKIIKHIISKVNKNKKCTVDLPITVQDEEGTVYAEVNKVIYIADRLYYKSNKTIQNEKKRESVSCKTNNFK